MYCLPAYIVKKKNYIYFTFFCHKYIFWAKSLNYIGAQGIQAKRKKRSLNPKWQKCQKGNQDLPFHSLHQLFWTMVCKVPVWEATYWDCTHKTLLNLFVPWRSTVHVHWRSWLGIKPLNANIMFYTREGIIILQEHEVFFILVLL